MKLGIFKYTVTVPQEEMDARRYLGLPPIAQVITFLLKGHAESYAQKHSGKMEVSLNKPTITHKKGFTCS